MSAPPARRRSPTTSGRPARFWRRCSARSTTSTIVAEAASGRRRWRLIEREHPDLALLDLQMPELDGIGVVRMLKKARLPLIAFVTAFDEYAVRAFEVNAVDYLLKPVEKARLREALNRAQERIEHAEIVAEQAARIDRRHHAYERPRGRRCSSAFRSGGATKSSSSRSRRSRQSSPKASCSI